MRASISVSAVAEWAALVAFGATLPIYTVNLAPFGAFEGFAALGPRYLTVLFAAVVLACAVLAVLGRLGVYSLDSKNTCGIVAPALLYVAGGAVFAFDAVVGVGLFPGSWGVAAACSGVGASALCVAWCMRLARLRLQDALVRVAVACGLIALVEAMLMGMKPPVAASAYVALLAVGAFGPLLPARGGSTVWQSGRDVEAVVMSRWSLLAMGVSFVGLMLIAFTLRVPSSTYFFGMNPIVVGVAAASLLVLGANRLDVAGVTLFNLVTRRCIPVLVLLLFALCTVMASFSGLFGATVLISYTVFGVTGVVAFAILIDYVHARGSRALSAMTLLVGAYAAVSLLGAYVNGLAWAAEHVMAILFAASVAHAAVLVAAPLFVRDDASAPGVPGPSPADPALVTARLADEFDLTERETTILGYIARGHGAAYIAEQLSISASTVRTHCNNLYRKLGAQTREGVLALIEEKAKTPGC